MTSWVMTSSANMADVSDNQNNANMEAYASNTRINIAKGNKYRLVIIAK